MQNEKWKQSNVQRLQYGLYLISRKFSRTFNLQSNLLMLTKSNGEMDRNGMSVCLHSADYEFGRADNLVDILEIQDRSNSCWMVYVFFSLKKKIGKKKYLHQR